MVKSRTDLARFNSPSHGPRAIDKFVDAVRALRPHWNHRVIPA